MKIEWPGIPEQFWPDTDKPWRVAWGIGCFRDFATQAEATTFADDMREGWTDICAPSEPFNAVEREVV